MNAIYRLAALLIGLTVVPLGAHAQSPTLSPDAAQGQAIAFDRLKGNCLACHTMRGSDVPSNVGPMLENMKTRYPNKADLIAILTDETQRNPQTVMPPFGRNLILTPHEIDLIVAFLYTL
ncbi:MAG: sulfur oxidation c-type cytochrome SoxX [Methylovirgula sp.]